MGEREGLEELIDDDESLDTGDLLEAPKNLLCELWVSDSPEMLIMRGAAVLFMRGAHPYREAAMYRAPRCEVSVARHKSAAYLGGTI